MKKIISLMLVAFLSIGFSSCSSDDGNASGTTSKKVREALLASNGKSIR